MDQIAREVAAPQPTTAELRAQIARTRTELSGTIEGIQDRLTGGGASRAVLGAVRRVPRKGVTAALAVAAIAGVGMFVRSRAKRRNARPVLAYSTPSVQVRGGTSKFVTAIGTGFAIWNALNRRAALR